MFQAYFLGKKVEKYAWATSKRGKQDCSLKFFKPELITNSTDLGPRLPGFGSQLLYLL